MIETRVWLNTRETTRGKAFHARYYDPVTGDRRSKFLCYNNSRKAAMKLAAAMEQQLNRGAYREVKRITWSEFVADHVGRIRGKRHATEAKRTLGEFGDMMRPAGPSAVRYDTIEGYVAKLRAPKKPGESEEHKNSVATINKKLRYLRAALNKAIKRGFATFNPIDGALFAKEEQAPPRIVTPEEEMALLDAAEECYGVRWRSFVHVALNTGARRGELLSLTWDRVELEGDEPQVHFSRTKSHRDRIVPINPEDVTVLRRLQAQTLRDGGPFMGMTGNIDNQWYRILSNAGLSGISIHDLRRTYVTRLIRAGVPLPTVQSLAGHSSINTTLRYYNWVSGDDKREAVKKLRGVG